MAKEDHYKAKYGDWAGNTNGHKPNYDRCCEEVIGAGRGMLFSQCARKAKYGPDGAYCKQHDPAAVAERRRVENEKYQQAMKKARPKWYAAEMLSILRQIADGHNDPRSIATEIVAKVDDN